MGWSWVSEIWEAGGLELSAARWRGREVQRLTFNVGSGLWLGQGPRHAVCTPCIWYVFSKLFVGAGFAAFEGGAFLCAIMGR